MALDYIAV